MGINQSDFFFRFYHVNQVKTESLKERMVETFMETIEMIDVQTFVRGDKLDIDKMNNNSFKEDSIFLHIELTDIRSP